MSVKKSFGGLLKEIRLQKGLSLREFSELIGISHAYLNKIEKGVNPTTGKEITPTIDTLIKISEALEMPLNKFLSLCGYEQEEKKKHNKKKNELIDLKNYAVEIIDTLKNSKMVVYNGKALEDKDIEIIVEALQIGIELSLKKLTE